MTISIDIQAAIQKARDVPHVTHAEAGNLSQTEYQQVVTVLESLHNSDWQQPTYCTEWNVRDMVAHLAGAVTGSTSIAEFLRQNVTHPYVKQATNQIDGTNKLQIEERAGKTHDALIDEFRQNGQLAVNNRQKLPLFIRKIPIPMEPLGLKPFEYLMDIIYPRDQWMHRYDICAATGKEMKITQAHDGRIVELVLLDIARQLAKQLKNRRIDLHLTGALNGVYQFGEKATPDCTLAIDVFDFNLRASERISVADALQRTAVSGDEATAKWFFTNATTLY